MLHDMVPLILGAWVVLTLGLFSRRPGGEAAVFSMLVGVAVLPVMVYPAAVFRDPQGDAGTAFAVTVAGGGVANRAAAIGLGCLCGLVVFDWARLRRIRWTWLDAPMGLWCAVPLLSAAANQVPAAAALSQVRDQVLTWGAPYLMGRLYLGDGRGLARLERGLALTVAAIGPLIVLEFVAGPFLYGRVYGPHPYQIEGAARSLFWRPLVFHEHGNQLGMAVATAAVAAVGLWRSRALSWFGSEAIPPAVIALGLTALAVACQSHGSLVLGLLGMTAIVLFDPERSSKARLARGLTGAGVVLVAAAVLTLVVAAAVASDPGLRQNVRGVFRGLGKASFTWRMARSQDLFQQIARHPVLGTGDRARLLPTTGGPVNPVNVGYGVLALGLYGVAGLCAWAASLAGPVVAALRRLVRTPGASDSLAVLACVLVLMNLGDAVLNSTWLLPITGLAGGLATWSNGDAAERTEGL